MQTVELVLTLPLQLALAFTTFVTVLSVFILHDQLQRSLFAPLLFP